MLFKILLISLLKAMSFGSIYLLQSYLHNIYIHTIYIEKLNILLISLLFIKFFISYTNYIKIFKLLENIYTSIKYILTTYTITINQEYMDNNLDDIEDNIYDNIENNIENNIDNNSIKLQISYIKDLIILYISLSFSSIFKLDKYFISYLDNKELLEYLQNEIKHINNKDNSTHLLISLIELLILQNFNNLNYINNTDKLLLIDHFNKLQNLILELYSLNNIQLYRILQLFTYFILFFNIIIIYIQYLNDDIISFIITILINFSIIFIDDIINSYLYIFDVLSNIFDFDNYIKEINEEIYIINYLNLSNKEFSL